MSPACNSSVNKDDMEFERIGLNEILNASSILIQAPFCPLRCTYQDPRRTSTSLTRLIPMVYCKLPQGPGISPSGTIGELHVSKNIRALCNISACILAWLRSKTLTKSTIRVPLGRS